MVYTIYRRGYSRYVILHENGIFRVRFALSYVSGMHRFTEKNASNTYYFFFVTQYFISISKNPIFTGFYGNRKNDKHIMDGLILIKNRLNIVFYIGFMIFECTENAPYKAVIHRITGKLQNAYFRFCNNGAFRVHSHRLAWRRIV